MGGGQAAAAQGAARQIRTELVRGAREVQLAGMPGRYYKLSAVDLYQQFLKVQLDRKGMAATGYGSSGWGLGLFFTVDPLSFVLPGVFSFSIEASAEMRVVDSLVLAVHRAMPLTIAAVTAPTQPLWQSSNPIVLLSLFGKSFSWTASAGATIGVEKELPLNSEVEETVSEQISSLTEISLAVGASASVSASYTYDRLYAQDPSPGWYASSEDVRLKTDFETILLPGKTATKREIISWINKFSDKVFELDQNARSALTMDPKQLRDKFLAKQDAIRRKDAGALARFLSDAKGLASTITKGSFPHVYKIYDGLSRRLGDLEAKSYSTQDLIGIIDNLKQLIPTPEEIRAYYILSSTGAVTFYRGNPDDLPIMQRAMDGMRAQLDTFRARLLSLKAMELPDDSAAVSSYPTKRNSIVSSRPYNRFNCFLKIASHTAEGTAGIAASLIAAYSEAKISGQYKRTAYRYQTFSPDLSGRGSLIYTQDTSITYRMATAQAGAGATFYGRSIEKDLIHHGMSYQSANVYWLYEDAASQGWSYARRGSGLSYGVSVQLDELARCIAEIRALNASNPSWSITGQKFRKLVDTLARYLRLSGDYLIDFLGIVNPDALRSSVSVPAVLLESSFEIPLIPPPDDANAVPYLIARKKSKSYKEGDQMKPQDVYRLDGIRNYAFVSKFSADLDNMPNAFQNCQNYLQTIRMRARMADFSESAIPFKLGVAVPGVDAAGVGITLTKIENAGQEGIIELGKADYRAADDAQRVPPVAIFHQ